jgi:hypothetical protein
MANRSSIQGRSWVAHSLTGALFFGFGSFGCIADVEETEADGVGDEESAEYAAQQVSKPPSPAPNGIACKAYCVGDPTCGPGAWVDGNMQNGMCCSATRCASCTDPAFFTCTYGTQKGGGLPLDPPPSNTAG